MSIVLRKLQGRRFALFEDLVETRRGVPVVIVTFIALLELSRESLVEVTQAEAFATIYVRLVPAGVIAALQGAIGGSPSWPSMALAAVMFRRTCCEACPTRLL